MQRRVYAVLLAAAAGAMAAAAFLAGGAPAATSPQCNYGEIILNVSPVHVFHIAPGKLNGWFIQHCPVAFSPSGVLTRTVLLNPAGLSLPSLRCTSKSRSSRPTGSGICFQPYAT